MPVFGACVMEDFYEGGWLRPCHVEGGGGSGGAWSDYKGCVAWCLINVSADL